MVSLAAVPTRVSALAVPLITFDGGGGGVPTRLMAAAVRGAPAVRLAISTAAVAPLPSASYRRAPVVASNRRRCWALLAAVAPAPPRNSATVSVAPALRVVKMARSSWRRSPVAKSAMVSMLSAARAVLKTNRSLPAPPSSWSLPAPPLRVSLPMPPLRLSLPASPLRMLLEALPRRMLARALPVPLLSAVPVRVRFSISAPSVKEIVLWTVSVPPPAASTTTSRLESTM